VIDFSTHLVASKYSTSLINTLLASSPEDLTIGVAVLSLLKADEIGAASATEAQVTTNIKQPNKMR
jgi:hypothetical protein